jgi:basic membrane protein A
MEKHMSKKWVVGSLAILTILSLLVGCQPKETAEALEPSTIKVAVVAGGEIGDKGFIDSANDGLNHIEEDLGLETMLLQGRDEPDRYLDLLLSAGEEADLVFVVPGYFFIEQLQEVVPKFPDTTFVFVDGITDIPDMTSIRYLEN